VTPVDTLVARDRAPARITVRPGDSLWRLSAARLPQDAPDAAVTAAWHRLYDDNRDLIGDDPDHIEPGQRLVLPEGADGDRRR
jgi:resuscitation-promoting factor RpfA